MKKLTILIVEDEGLIAINTEMLLEGMGHHVLDVSPSGKTALETAERKVPDLALVDIKLRGAMDGVTTARELKERWGVPIIFITGNTDRGTLDNALSVEPLGLLQKPFDDDEFEEAIKTAVERIENSR